MDISPAPAPPHSLHLPRPLLVHAQTTLADQFDSTSAGYKNRPFLDRACSTNDFPFLKNLFQTTSSEPSASSSAAPLQRASLSAELGASVPSGPGGLTQPRFPTALEAPFQQHDDFDFTGKVAALQVRSRSGSEEEQSSNDGALTVPGLSYVSFLSRLFS